jgi:APA family basic amino acid/polyamine antiporter
MNSADRQSAAPLTRQLGVVSLGALLVGVTIGSGIFRVPSTVAAQIGSVGGIAIVWIAGAVISLAGALPLIAVTTALPRPGGAYAYMREAYGPLLAFLYGWIKLLVTGPAGLAAAALIFAEYSRAFVPLTDAQVHVVAGGLVVMLTAASIRSVKWSAAVQNVSTLAKVLVLAVLAALIFVRGDASSGAFSHPVTWGGFGPREFWAALIVVLYTYTGWVEFTYVAGEVRDPVRTYPRALLGGMAIIVVLYVVINAAYLYVLPIPAVAKSSLVASSAVSGPLGSRAASMVAALVMVSTFGSINGTILAGPRVYFAMGQDGVLFRKVGAVHTRNGTPYVALLVNMCLGLVALSTHSFDQLARIFVLGRWPFITLAVATVFFVPRRRPELAPLCRRWGYPFVPAAFLLFSLAMLANEIYRRPTDFAPSLGIVVLGIAVYYASQAWSNRRTAARSPAPETAG